MDRRQFGSAAAAAADDGSNWMDNVDENDDVGVDTDGQRTRILPSERSRIPAHPKHDYSTARTTQA